MFNVRTSNFVIKELFIMTVMYSFCFWYSVRLGSIIVAFTCMMQCITALIFCIYGMSDLERTSSNIDDWIQTCDFGITKVFFEAMKDDPKSFLTAFISILSVYFCSCILLIYAAFQCSENYMYPFMTLDFIRLVFLSSTLVIFLMVLKENTINLGVIIGCSISGVFTLLYLWYQWFCTVSLWQIVREIKRLDLRLHREEPNRGITSEKMRNEKSLYNNSFYLPDVTF